MTARLLVTHQSAAALERFAHPLPVATLIVDNASTDQTRAVAARLGYRVLALEVNYGFGTAIMCGLEQLEDDLVFIANPDLEIAAADLERLVAAAERYPDADLFLPALEKADGSLFFRCESRFEPRARDRQPPQGECCIRTPSGAAMLVRRKSFLAHGFDARIFLYFEDDDLGLSYARDKRAMIYVPQARARHAGNLSSASSPALEARKNISFGWSWGYVMEKHGLGLAAAALQETRRRRLGALLTLRWRRARRHAGVAEGLRRYLRGERAPYLP